MSKQPRRVSDSNYWATERIGKGSFSVVWKGEYRGLNQSISQIAVKSISVSKLAGSKLQANLQSEIDVMKSLHHPNIVRLIDELKTGNHIYLILEYADCGDLSKLISRLGQLPTELVRHYGWQLALGLKALHSKSLVHRDLKPHNLLLYSNNPSNNPSNQLNPYNCTLKIADFGFARELLSTDMAATLCGSPLYMAPEILAHKAYDSTADLWSVGAILYEMSFAKPPYNSSSPSELLMKIDATENKLHESINQSELPDDLKHLIINLLKKDQAKRLSFQQFFSHPFWRKSMTSSDDQSNSQSNSQFNSQSLRHSNSQLTQVSSSNSRSSSESIKQSADDSTKASFDHTINQSIKSMIESQKLPLPRNSWSNNQSNENQFAHPLSRPSSQPISVPVSQPVQSNSSTPTPAVSQLTRQLTNKPPPPLVIQSPPPSANDVFALPNNHSNSQLNNQSIHRSSQSASRSFDGERKSNQIPIPDRGHSFQQSNQPLSYPVNQFNRYGNSPPNVFTQHSPGSSGSPLTPSQHSNPSNSQSINRPGSRSRTSTGSRSDSNNQNSMKSSRSGDPIDQDYICVDPINIVESSPTTQSYNQYGRPINSSTHQLVAKGKVPDVLSRDKPPRSPSISSLNQSFNQSLVNQSYNQSYNQSNHQSYNQSYNMPSASYNNPSYPAIYESMNASMSQAFDQRAFAQYTAHDVATRIAENMEPVRYASVQDFKSCKSLKDAADFLYDQTSRHSSSHSNKALHLSAQSLFLASAARMLHQPVNQLIDLCCVDLYFKCVEKMNDTLLSIQLKIECFKNDFPIDKLPQATGSILKETLKWSDLEGQLREYRDHCVQRLQECSDMVSRHSQVYAGKPRVIDCRIAPVDASSEPSNSEPARLIDYSTPSQFNQSTELTLPTDLYLYSQLAQHFWIAGVNLEFEHQTTNQSTNQSISFTTSVNDEQSEPINYLQDAFECYETADGLFRLAYLELADEDDRDQAKHDGQIINQHLNQLKRTMHSCKKRLPPPDDTPRSRSSSITSSPSINQFISMSNQHSPSLLSHSPSDNISNFHSTTHSPQNPSPSFNSSPLSIRYSPKIGPTAVY